jgi:hypothetical protein
MKLLRFETKMLMSRKERNSQSMKQLVGEEQVTATKEDWDVARELEDEDKETPVMNEEPGH